VPAFVVLAALLAVGVIGAGTFVVGWLASVLAAAALSMWRLHQLGRLAAWLDRLAEAPGASVAGLPGPLVRPAAELAELLRRHELRIEAQDRTLASVLEAVPDPILVIDARLDVIRVNAAARRDFGIENRRLPLARVLRDPGVLAAVRGTLEAGTASNVTFTPTLYRQRLFSARVEPLDLGEEGPGVLVALREQTEQVMIERMRSDFVANASHEIRNPLASILGIVETLRGPARHDAKGREMFLELLAGEAARMTRLVDDLLSLSRIELAARQPPTERCEPKALLEQVIERMYAVAAGAKVRLVASIPTDLPLIVCDPDQLHQLFVNLIDNAIKYGGEGQMVRITAEAVAAAPAAAGPVAGRPCVRVAVQDEGPGIAREHIPRLTERFYRVDSARSRKLRGTGLGLAIVKHILRRHQGHLAVQSELGHGSTFTVYLPAAD
jgi:two-component system, OmpR family, phosphate regulon sensor histidine kinase PhoR